MKKLFCLLLALMLIAISACAEAPEEAKAPETRTRVLETEFGVSEITETYFAYENFSLWYRADKLKAGFYFDHADFTPADAAEEDRSTSYLIVKADIAPEQAENMIAEATGGYDDTWTIAMNREFETDGGNRVLSVDANNGLEIHRYYIVVGEESCLLITAMYQADIAEEDVFFLDVMTKTIEFMPKA